MRWATALLVLASVTWPGCASALARGPKGGGGGDVVMAAMVAELERSQDGLKIAAYEAPYYVAYAIKDVRKHAIAGKQGAIYGDESERKRLAYVDVRVGSYTFDSSEDAELEWVQDGVYEPTTQAPIEDDAQGLRHTLWLLTDLRYKQALSSYLKMKGKRVYAPEDKKKRPSFSAAPAARQADRPLALTMDRERWRRVVREIGAELGRHPELFDAEVSVDFSVETRWFVNTEGARVRTELPMYSFALMAWARADDGMLLDRSFNAYAPSEAGLPDDAALKRAAERVVSELQALRKAPQLEPYTGPAILEPRATGVFFHEVLGHRLEGHRQDDDEEGQTFTSHLGKPILPAFLSVVDDPTQAAVDGTPLNGHYTVDDEGVAAERVVLVDRGVLKNFLLPRRPVEGFDHSNGHGRAQAAMRPVARMGNTLVLPHETVSRAKLRAMLLAEVKRQGKPFGLIIRDITGGATNTSSYGFQAFKGGARMVYKVDPASGAETLVRGVEIVGTPLVSIGKIIAAADDTGIFNGYCGAESGMVPVSTVAPSTLFSEIELQRSARARSKGPVMPPPTR
jgi:predicted Zn-dependent protease